MTSLSINDPYFTVKDSITRSFYNIENVLNEFKKQINISPNHNFSKISDIDDYQYSLNELKSAIFQTETDLNELSNAVAIADANRNYYKLSENDILLRKQFISDSRKKIKLFNIELANQFDFLNKLQATVFKSEKSQLLSNEKDPYAILEDGSEQDNSNFITGQFEKQQQIYQHQDQQLDDLHSGVKILHKMSEDIHYEVSDQNRILDTLEVRVDKTNTSLDSANKSVTKILKMSKENLPYCVIIVLIIILVILLILAIKLPGRTQPV